MIKCVLRFDRMFWPADKDWIDFPHPTETRWGDWTNYLPACGPPVIVGFNAARMGDEIEALSNAATTTSAMAALRAMFGSSVPAPVAAQFSRWRADPFDGVPNPFRPWAAATRTAAYFLGLTGTGGCSLPAKQRRKADPPPSTAPF